MIAVTRLRIASSARDASALAARSWSWQDLGGHRGGELLAPASPWQRLVVEQQQRPGGVALETAGLDVRLEVQYDPLVAEADAEVLKAPVPAAGLRQHVVELVAEHGGGVTGRGPQRAFAAPAAMVVVEHPPAARSRRSARTAPAATACCSRWCCSPWIALQRRARVAVLVADEHLDLRGESQEAAVEVAGDPLPAAVGDAVGGLDGVVALVLAEQHDLGAVVLSAQ